MRERKKACVEVRVARSFRFVPIQINAIYIMIDSIDRTSCFNGISN